MLAEVVKCRGFESNHDHIQWAMGICEDPRVILSVTPIPTREEFINDCAMFWPDQWDHSPYVFGKALEMFGKIYDKYFFNKESPEGAN